MRRNIEKDLMKWHLSSRKALLIDGARQVGKTYSIRQFLKSNAKSYIEINFFDNEEARELIASAKSSNDVLLYLSTIYGKKMHEGETIIFFDEVQECENILTVIKFLVEEGSYRYILSGSLLGVEMKNIRSLPVGYVDMLHMYPMTFDEFCVANGVGESAFEHLRGCYERAEAVNESVHEKFMELYQLYLIVGGMPAVVETYIDSHNLKRVEREQHSIVEQYKADISKYDKKNRLYLADVFDLIPSELNAQSKRFVIANIKNGLKFDRAKDAFLWLVDAGVAIPTYCVNEPSLPLLLSKSRNLLKLFMSDVGLLASMYAGDIQIKLLKRELDINYGGIYENAVAEELNAHGITPYYYKNNKLGELDFVIELNGECVVIEVKSGKNYEKHSALNNVLKEKNFGVDKAIVLNNYNVKKKNNIIYYPIYMTMFMRQKELDDIIYTVDTSILS